MNRIYKVVWSKAKNCYVVASELAKRHTKSPRSSIISRTLVASVLACVCSFGAVLPVSAAGDPVTYDDNTYEVITLEGVGVGYGTRITNLADGSIAAASTDAVTGAQLYATNQQIATLVTAINTNSATIGDVQTDVSTLKTNYTTMRSDVNTLQTQVETGFNVNANGAKVKQVNPASNYINFKSGDNITVAADGEAIKISAVANGAVATGNTGLVTGGTVAGETRVASNGNYITATNTAGANLIALDGAIKVNADAIDDINDSAVKYDGADKAKVTLAGASGTTIDNVKDGALSATSKEAVNGSQLYTTNQNLAQEVTDRTDADTALSNRIGTLSADGNYITQANNVSQNLTALDGAVKANEDAIGDINDALDDKANVSLDNINAAGETVVKDLAKEAVKVVNGTNTTVTEGTDGDAKTYAVNVTTNGAVASGDTGIVTGGTVYDALQAEARPAADGNYIAVANTAGANLTALDTAVKANEDAIADLGTGKANVALDNITDAGKTVIQDATNVVSGDSIINVSSATAGGVKTYTVTANISANGQVATGDTGLVSGDTVYNEVRPASDGNYIATSATTGANLTALDTQIKAMDDATQAAFNDVNDALDTKANVDASNVSAHTANWGSAIGTGAVTSGNGELVTGGTVYDALQAEARPASDGNYITVANTAGANLTALDTAVKANEDAISDLGTGKANVALDNITDAGKTVIQDATNIVSGDSIIDVTSATAGGVKTYTVKANITANGQVASGDTGLVSGDTVYTEVRPASDGEYVKTAETTGANLLALDTQVKANKDAVDDINDALDDKANVSLDNIDTAGEGVVRTLAQEAVKVVDGTNTTVTEGTDGDAKTYAVTVTTDGVVASANTGIVTGGTVYDALQAEARPASDGNYITMANTAGANLTALDTAVKANEDAISDLGTGKANVGLDNITADGKAVITGLTDVVAGVNTYITNATDANGKKVYTVSAFGEGVVENNNTGLIPGGTLYHEVRPASDGNYIATANTTAQNLTALDTQVKANADAIDALDDGKADTDLGNITADGETVIKDLAKDAVKVVAGTNTTVTEGTDGDAKTYAVNVTTNGAVASGNTGIVTGGTVYDAIQNYDATNGMHYVSINSSVTSAGSNYTNDGASGQRAIAIGESATATAKDAVAIGYKAKAEGEGAFAFGEGATSDGKGTVAFTGGNEAHGTYSMAWGMNSVAGVSADGSETFTGATAFGTGTEARNDGATAMGNWTIAEGQNSVAMGNGARTREDAKASLAMGQDTQAAGTGSFAGGTDSIAGGLNSFAHGNTAEAVGSTAIAMGDDAKAVGDEAVALGYNSKAYGDYSVAILGGRTGDGSFEYDDDTGEYDVDVTDNAIGAFAAGFGSVAMKDYTVAIGRHATVENDQSIALGEDATVVADSSAALGYGSVATEENVISVGHKAGDPTYNGGTYSEALNRKIVNVADGVDDTDAVNVGQMNTALDDKANTDLDNITDDGKTVVRDLAKEAVKVIDGTNTTVTEGTDGDAKTYAVDVTVDGVVASGNTGIVDGGTVYDALQDQKEEIDIALDTKANKDASNVASDADNWATAIGTGTIDPADGKLVTGATVAGETRVASDGNYVLATNTAGQNLSALDRQVKANEDAIDDIGDALDGKANVALDNITTDGRNVVKGIAQEAVSVANGNHTTVTSEFDPNGNKTYSVNVADNGTVTAGNAELVTGGTVYDALQDMGQTKLNTDLSNISEPGKDVITGLINVQAGNDNTEVTSVVDRVSGIKNITVSALSNGQVAQGDTGIVTGGTVYDALQGVSDDLQDQIDTKANRDMDNLTTAGERVLQQASIDAVKVGDGDNTTVASEYDADGNITYKVTATTDGVVANANTGIVSGGTVFAETRVPADGNYITAANTAGQNISALDTALKATNDAMAELGNDAVKYDSATKSTVTLAGEDGTKITNVKEGALAADSTDAVNGAQLFATNENVATNTQDISDLKDLSNITTAGETVVKDLAKDAVKIEAGDRVTVTSAENNGAMVYTVSANNDGVVAQGDTNLVSGDTVYSAIEDAKEEVNDATDTKLADYALKDASNVASDADNWATAIGTGAVDPADGKLVTGATVAGETRVAADGNYVTVANTAGQNITALDTAVKANEDAIAGLGTDKANVELDNISTEGETVIKDLAKEAVKVVNGDNTTVTEGTDGDAKTYAVHTVTDGVVEAGNTGIVTGDTVYNAIENSKTKFFGVKATGNYNPNEDGSGATGDNSIAIGTSPMAMGNESIAIGSVSATMDEGGVAVGYLATALGKGSVAVGKSSQAIMDNTTAIGANAVAPYENSVAIGAGSEAKEANVFAVGAEGKERRIVSVAAGTADTDAVNVAQMNTMAGDKADTDLGNITDDGKEVIKENAKSAINVVGTEPITVAKTDENGVDTYTVSVTADGVVEAGNTGLVTGDTVFNETRIARDGNYVTVANTAKDNIMALDSALKDVSDVANDAKDGLDGKANTDMDNLSDAGKTEVRTLAQEAVKVVEGEYTTVTEGTDGNAKTYAVNVKVDGRIEDGDTGLVDGGTVYNAIGDAVDTINNSMESKADTNLRNINQDGETVIRNIARDAVQIEDGDHISSERVYDADGNSIYKVSAVTDGAIASGDTGIVSGGMVYAETRPATDGNYIAVASTAGENLTALDTALKDVSDIATEAKDGLDGKAGVDLDNITTDGKTVIKDLAKASVEVKAGEHVSVVKADTNGVDTYTVSAVVDGQVAEGNTGIVDGGTVFSAIKDATDSTNDALDGKANVALDNLSTDGQQVLQQSAITAVKLVDGENTTVTSTYDANGNISYAVKANATGTIAQGNTGLVDGGTVYDALKAQEEAATDALAGKANIDASNVNTSDADKWGEKIAVGEVADGDVRAVSGDTVSKLATDLRNEAAGALDGKANVSLDNITDAGKDVITGLTDVTNGDAHSAIASNIDRTGKKTYTITINTDGQVAQGNAGIVTGNTVYEALQTATDAIADNLDGKANVGFDNISEDGKDVITGLTDVVSGDNYSNVESAIDRNGKKTYTITTKVEGQVAQGDTGIVTGGTVYDALQNASAETQDALDGKANVGLDNISEAGKDVITGLTEVGAGENIIVDSNVDRTGKKTYTVSAPANGQIASGDTGIVSGDAVYQALQNVNSATQDALDGKANIALDNIDDAGKDVITGLTNVVSGDDYIGVASDVDRTGKKTYTITTKVDGAIASGDTGLVTGGQVYDAIQDQADATTDALDGKANVALDNLDATGEEKLQTSAQTAVKVADGEHTTASTEYDANGNLTYKVNVVTDGQVAQGDTNVVSGGTVYDALKTTEDNLQGAIGDLTSTVNDGLDGKANVGLDNITDAGKDVITGLTDVVTGNDRAEVTSVIDRQGKKTYTVTVKADGQVVAGDEGLVTGGTVADALQNATDGLNDTIDDLQEQVDGKANVALDNITDAGKTVLQQSAISAVKVADGTNTTVTSEYDANGNITYKVEAKATGSVNANDTGLVDGGTVYDAIQNANDAIDDKLADKANVDASNVTDANAWGEKIATGAVAQGDVRAVSGDTVFNAMEGKMATDLSNLAEGGKDVITGLIEVEAGNDNTKVESNVSREGIKTFTVSALSDGQVAQGDTGIVTGGVVYDALKDATDNLQEAVDGKANVGLDNLNDAGKTVIQQGAINAVTVADGVNTTVASEFDANGNVTYKVTTVATGAIEANNTGLVDGGTVYDALKEQADSTADALDTKANVDASNVTDSAAWAEKLGTGEVEANNEELVTGATVYDAIKEAGDATQEALDGKANVSLDNLNTDGKNVLQQSAISAVKTEAGEHTTVTPSYDANGNISYKVDVQDDGQVVAGNTGLVTGGTVADALAQASADTEEALEGKANVGLDNITTEGKNVITGLTEVVSGDNYINVASATDQSGKKTYTVTVKMDGSIAENDTGLVTGGQVYESLKDTEDGLKKEIQDLSDTVTEGLDTKANRDMDNLTDAGKEVLQKSAQDAVKVEAGNSASVTPSYDADGNISYKVDVVTDGQAQAGDTHAVSGDTLYNAISDIQDASEGKANVSLDNIDSDGKKVITGLTEVVAGNANTEVTSSYDADGKKTYVVSALANGQIAEGNEGIVTGGTVYDALKEQADAMAEGLDGKANVSLDNLNTDGKNTLRTSAQEAVKVSGEGNAVVSPTYDANGNIDYKISITEGEVGANETGLVSGKTVYEALQEQAGDIDDKLAGKANVALDNITSEGKDVITDLTEVKAGDRYGLVERSKDNDGKVTYTVKTVVDGAVADGDEGLVTGGDVFNAVDDAKSELQDKIDTLADDTQEALDNKANRDMDNLTDTGKDAVKGLAQDAVQVVAGDNVGVTSAYDANGNKIYTVSALGQGTIAFGDTGLVTGGTVFTETRPAVDGNFVAKDKSAGENLSALDTAIKETRDMIDENNNNAVKYDSVQKNTVTMEGEEGTRITNLKDARLTSDSTDAVTGKQLVATNDAVAENAEAITEIRDTIGTMEDGEYISKDNTIAENLKGLDDALVAQQQDMEEKLAGKANTDMDNLTDTGKQNVKDLAKEAVTVSAGDHVAVTTTEENGNIDYKVSVVVDGAVEEGNTGLVDGGMVYDAIQATAGEIDEKLAGKANTNLDNITDEGREVIRETMAEDLATKANVDASNVTDAYAWGEKIATGEIAEGDVRAVSGDTVNSAISEVNDKIQELDDKKADKDLGNITPEGEQKIKDVMAEPLAEKANTGLDNLTDEGKGVIRDVAQNAVSLEDGDTTKVSSRTDEEGNRIYKVEALAEGKIEAGDTRAVSGGTMAEFVEAKIGTVKDGNHVKADKPIADNINALDAAVGKTEDGFFVKSDASVGENLNVLDEQVARNTQNISGLYQNQKVMTKEMREGFAKSAALAGLHPFENDSDQKWNVAAALGGYKGEHAGAVGVFYRPSDRVMINAGSTISDSDNLYNVGVSVALDKGSGLSKSELKKRVGDLENIIRVMAKKIDTLEAKQMSLNGVTKEFPDVPKAHWAHNAVANLHGSDIVQGYPDGEFKGEKPMTRYEYAEMLYNAINTGKDVPKEMIEEYKAELRQIEQNKKK